MSTIQFHEMPRAIQLQYNKLDVGKVAVFVTAEGESYAVTRKSGLREIWKRAGKAGTQLWKLAEIEDAKSCNRLQKFK